MKKMIMLIGMFVVVSAHATNDDVVNSQMYVDNLVGNLQTNLPAKTSDKVVTYTTTAGTTGERDIKTTLGNESTNTSDIGIATVGTVKTALDNKQNALEPLGNRNILTYSATAGTPVATPIYNQTNSISDTALVDAKTLNDAVIAGVNAEATKITTDPKGALWVFNRTPPRVLPSVPAEYTELEYIESDGICYFNTSIAWENVSMFRGKAQVTQIVDVYNKSVLGGGSRNVSEFYGFNYNSSTGYAQWYWNTNITPTTTAEFNISYIGNQYIGTINGTSTASNQSKFPGNVQIMNTGSSNTRYFTGRVWYIQLFDSNGAMIFNGIPARNTSNTVGIYDTVSDTFLTNAGSGNCIAGPVAE